MNVVHLSAFVEGGASRAAIRLHHGLRLRGDVHSFFVVGHTRSRLPGVHTLDSPTWARWTNLWYGRTDRLWRRLSHAQWDDVVSFNRLPRSVHRRLVRFHPDIVHLHWIGSGYIPVSSLARFRIPVVWTMHDMWPFTGVCHYDQGCERYRTQCVDCPIFPRAVGTNPASAVWARKARVYRGIRLVAVSPSQWLADCARQSPLFAGKRVEVIPYGIDTTVFSPQDRLQSRSILGLPRDKRLVLFGAVSADRRKGVHYLLDCLGRLHDQGMHETTELVTFGRLPPLMASSRFRLHSLGTLTSDAQLAQAYSAADVFLAPSLQDNLPNTVIEALACGLPCVAFRIGGMPDLIADRRTGYLAEPLQTEDLAAGVRWALAARDKDNSLSAEARRRATERYTLERQAADYLRLYRELSATNEQVARPAT